MDKKRFNIRSDMVSHMTVILSVAVVLTPSALPLCYISTFWWATVWVRLLDFFSGYIWFYFAATLHVPLFLSALTWIVKPEQHVRVSRYLLSNDFYMFLSPERTRLSRWIRNVWFCFHAVCCVLCCAVWMKATREQNQTFQLHMALRQTKY